MSGSHWPGRPGLLAAATRVTITRNGEVVQELPADYYSPRFFTDLVIKSIDENGGDG